MSQDEILRRIETLEEEVKELKHHVMMIHKPSLIKMQGDIHANTHNHTVLRKRLFDKRILWW